MVDPPGSLCNPFPVAPSCTFAISPSHLPIASSVRVLPKCCVGFQYDFTPTPGIRTSGVRPQASAVKPRGCFGMYGLMASCAK